MEGGKIKNVVIVILLILNGFLLFLVGGRRMETTQSHESARNSAIQIIRDGGVQLEAENVPDNTELPVLQAERNLEEEKNLAAAVLGADVSVEALGGEVYRCHNGNGWIQFHSTGEFMAELGGPAFALEGESAKHAAALLSELRIESRVLTDTVAGGTGSVTLRQTVSGVPVLNCQAVVHYRDGVIVSITQGRRLPGEVQAAAPKETMSVSTALMRMYNGLKALGDVYTRIEEITPAYTMSVDLSGTARLDPVWYIKTDTGSYQMDIHTGRLSRLGGAAVAADAQIVLAEE
ncbi:MAG: hypothetical protein E7440_00420 [Ruminococcaceae bacterium]|nr:hypothetical protein [Oscillospiraceae bacterium]